MFNESSVYCLYCQHISYSITEEWLGDGRLDGVNRYDDAKRSFNECDTGYSVITHV